MKGTGKMRNFVIVTDSSSELKTDYIVQNHVGIIPYFYQIDNVIHRDDNDHSLLEFYQKMRHGGDPSILRITSTEIKERLEYYLKEKLDILLIYSSFALTNDRVKISEVAEELRSQFIDQRIVIIDSMTSSVCLGMLVHRAVIMKKNGKTINEIIDWLEKNLCYHNLIMMTQNNNVLYKNGLISKSVYLRGKIRKSNMLLYLNDIGLPIFLKSTGHRKKSMMAISKLMEKKLGIFSDCQTMIYIVHGNAFSDAKYLAGLVSKKYPNASIYIHTLTPSIGVYTGPSTVGIGYIGEFK